MFLKGFHLRTALLSLLVFIGFAWLLILNVDYNRDGQSVISFPPISRANMKSSFSILTANVGNLSLGCRKYKNNLCYKDVEERIATNIRALSPDIILMQEVLAPWQCQQEEERDPRKVCFYAQDLPQIRRLVGFDYSIACDQRNQFTCIAIKTSVGVIENCPQGSLCTTARTVPPFTGCDSGFSISATTVRLLQDNLTFDIVNVHLQSTSVRCRVVMLDALFRQPDKSATLLRQPYVLIGGDFNFDPWRDSDASVRRWWSYYNRGWQGYRFRYHSGIIEHDPPYYTSFFFLRRRTFDFVVSNFANGRCVVLGESPGTTRLDGGKGMDHRAVYGFLTYPRDER